MKRIFEPFIKQKTLFNFVSFLTEQTLRTHRDLHDVLNSTLRYIVECNHCTSTIIHYECVFDFYTESTFQQ